MSNKVSRWLCLMLCSVLFLPNVKAQIEGMEATSFPSGKTREIKIDITQHLEYSSNGVALSPSMILLNSSKVSVPKYLQKDFFRAVKEENELFQFRYLEDRCEATLFTSENQRNERQMQAYRKEVEAYNYVSSVLEKKLQHNLQNYFSFSQCYLYDLTIEDKSHLKAVSDNFKSQFLILPDILKIDTVGDAVETLLQLEIWDSRVDSISKKAVLQAKTVKVSEGLDKVISEAELFIMSFILRDSKFKSRAQLDRKRRTVFSNFLETQPSQNWIKEEIKDEEHGEYLGALTNESKDRFIAFTLQEYIPNFAHKMSNKMLSNPYPDVDVNSDPDPMRKQYVSKTILGLLINNEWYLEPIQEDFIYTKDEQKAKEIYLGCFANLGLFEKNSVELHKNYWNRGFLTPVDTATMVNPYDPAVVKEADKNFVIKKANSAHFQGLPKYVVQELIREYNWGDKTRNWKTQVSDEYLKPLFSEKSFRKQLDIKFIDTDVRSYQLLHDYEMTKAIIPVWVKEVSKQERLRFFYWDSSNPNNIYEWTYLPKVIFDENGSKQKNVYLVEAMSQALPWNFVRMTLDDDFWNRLVYPKEGEEHKYLNLIELGE